MSHLTRLRSSFVLLLASLLIGSFLAAPAAHAIPKRAGAGAASQQSSPPIPPQRTPAPVARSHYLRRLDGRASHDQLLMRRMGRSDAAHNRPGHRYLILHDIGAQTRGGVVLSATVRYITYRDLVGALQAYIAGYSAAQRPDAPAMIAIGTNNDGAVSRQTGRIWARRVVAPVAAWASAHTQLITVAGANDMEPGFRAGLHATHAWLNGFLAGGRADFVFNGSADGCPTDRRHHRCNNGWTTGGLHWLSGGGRWNRVMALPQIYNTTMPWQWQTISAVGNHPLHFVGPLTERHACLQARSCHSVANPRAWRMLFHALRSHRRTAVSALPYGPDLSIS